MKKIAFVGTGMRGRGFFLSLNAVLKRVQQKYQELFPASLPESRLTEIQVLKILKPCLLPLISV